MLRYPRLPLGRARPAAATLPAVNKQERTYEILRDRIHTGVYAPMARLNIDALARELGVSPIPVREALRRLEAQGWVQFRPNAGAIVSPVDDTSWEQAMVALAILEGAATAEAQRHLRTSDFTRLRKIAADMESQDDPVRFGKLNRRLHEAIVTRCGNTWLLDLLQQTHDRLDRVRSTMFSYLPERAAEAAREHARLIELLTGEPRVGMLEASRRLGVARGTIQARLDRMQRRGVITGYGPDIDPAAIGHSVTAFVTLELTQGGGRDQVAARLEYIAEVLEAHTITGPGDVLCRVVARDNADLQRVIDAIVDVPGVIRTSTVIALATAVGYRTTPLVRATAAAPAGMR